MPGILADRELLVQWTHATVTAHVRSRGRSGGIARSVPIKRAEDDGVVEAISLQRADAPKEERSDAAIESKIESHRLDTATTRIGVCISGCTSIYTYDPSTDSFELQPIELRTRLRVTALALEPRVGGWCAVGTAETVQVFCTRTGELLASMGAGAAAETPRAATATCVSGHEVAFFAHVQLPESGDARVDHDRREILLAVLVDGSMLAWFPHRGFERCALACTPLDASTVCAFRVRGEDGHCCLGTTNGRVRLVQLVVQTTGSVTCKELLSFRLASAGSSAFAVPLDVCECRHSGAFLVSSATHLWHIYDTGEQEMAALRDCPRPSCHAWEDSRLMAAAAHIDDITAGSHASAPAVSVWVLESSDPRRAPECLCVPADLWRRCEPETPAHHERSEKLLADAASRASLHSAVTVIGGDAAPGPSEIGQPPKRVEASTTHIVDVELPTALSCLCTSPAPDGSVMYEAEITRQQLAASLRASAAAPTSLERAKAPARRGAASAAGRSAASMPVTFHAKVRSSGYGAAAPRKPAWAVASAAAARAPAPPRPPPTPLSSMSYPLGAIPTQLDLDAFPGGTSVTGATVALRSRAASQATLPAAPLTTVRVSHHGTLVCLGASDGTVWLSSATATAHQRLRIDGGAFVIRHGPTVALPRITALSISHQHYATQTAPAGQVPPAAKAPSSAVRAKSASRARPRLPASADRAHVILACGAEPRALLWPAAVGDGEPLLTLDDCERDQSSRATASAATQKTSANAPFPSAVSSGTFVCQDRLIALASGAGVYAMAWSLFEPSDDAAVEEEDVVRLRRQRTQKRATWKRAAWWSAAEEGCSVACVAGHNAFQSHLIFTSGTDRTLRVFDLGAPGGVSECVTIRDAHDRTAHHIALLSASAYADVTRETYDALLTCAVDGVVKLWDLRSAACVQRLSGAHVHRAHRCEAAFSPDGMCVAVASEDRTVALYDLRTGAVVDQLRGASDVVTSVAYHPLAPCLLSASLDAALRVYAPNTPASLSGDAH